MDPCMSVNTVHIVRKQMEENQQIERWRLLISIIGMVQRSHRSPVINED